MMTLHVTKNSAWLTLAIILLATLPAHAELPFANQIPAESILVIGAADTAGLLSKAKTLPLISALMQYLQSPSLTQDLDYQAFDLERKKLEAALGYRVTAEEFMARVFKNVLFYATPAKDGGKVPSVVLQMAVGDKAKAAKLISVLDEKNKEFAAAEDSATTAAATPAAKVSKFKKLTINDTIVSHFTHPSDKGQLKEGYYALAGERFVFSNVRAGLAQALQGLDAGTPTLTKNADYARLVTVLPTQKADLTAWFDADYLARHTPHGALLKNMPGVSKSNKLALALNVVPNGVLIKSATTADPTAGTNVKPGKLDGLVYIEQKPLAGVVYGVLDPDHLVGELNKLKALPGLLGGEAASGDPIAEFEQATGISVQQELVPALGEEFFFGLNKVDMTNTTTIGFFPFPTIDLSIGVKVRDSAKMAGVMKKVEMHLEARLSEASGTPPPTADAPATTPPMAFQSVPAGNVNVRTLPFSQGLAPSYALLKDYLIIGLNPTSVTSALTRAAGQSPSIGASPAYIELNKLAGNNPQLYSYSTVDVSQFINLIGAYLPMILSKQSPSAQEQLTGLFNNVLIHAGTVAALEAREKEIAVSYTKLIMR